MSIREVALPSGATLKIQPAKFADAKALLTAATSEFRKFELSSQTDLAAVYKELACIGLSSPAVEKALWQCMTSCLYVIGDVTQKVTPELFDDVARRDDFITICSEVAKDNIGPFTKSLFALFSQAQGQNVKSPESESMTMTS